ncbi:MAG: F0F1 ATP synthase subunit B' [Alphaproteobacteria bacterium]|nr:F0F1 ATP synthase subunit B' [Alphaproteobacteria bacterium]
MPQLDVNSYLPQLVWLAITFAALYLLMARLALPRIADVLAERSKRREDNLARAEELQAEAEAAAKAYENVLAESRAAAHEQLMLSADAAKNRADDAIRALDARLAGEIAAAEDTVAAAKEEALKEATAIAAEAARLAAEKIAGISIDDAAAEDAAAAARKARA